MNRRGVLITVMIVQLVLLVVVSIITVESQRQVFTGQQEFNKLASYKIAALSDNLVYELDLVNNQSLTTTSRGDYFEFVNLTYTDMFNVAMIFNSSYLYIEDTPLKFFKEMNL